MLKALQDVATVAQDVLAVASYFSEAPAYLLNLGHAAVRAVLHRDVAALSALVDEAAKLLPTLQADLGNAQPSIDRLRADLQTFLADLS